MSTTEHQIADGAFEDDGGDATMAATAKEALASEALLHPLAAYVPMGVTSAYKPPKAGVDPDTTKTWIRRAYPIVKSHKGHFLVALILSFVGLVLQLQIPQFLSDAIDNSLGPHPTVPLSFLRLLDSGPGRHRRHRRVLLADVAVQGGVRHRVRPAQQHL